MSKDTVKESYMNTGANEFGTPHDQTEFLN